MKNISPELRAKLLTFQKSERTEAIVYKRLAKQCESKKNCEILNQIAADELRHAEFWRNAVGGEVVEGDSFRAYWWSFISRFFGITFGLRLMESGEESTQKIYAGVSDSFPGVNVIIADEEEHEAGGAGRAVGVAAPSGRSTASRRRASRPHRPR